MSNKLPTLLPVAQGDGFTTLTTPGDTGLGWSRRGAPERHVRSLSHNHVRAGRIVQDVRWNCNQNKATMRVKVLDFLLIPRKTTSLI